MNAQAAIRTALEARATALTGWAAISLLAATGAVFSVPTLAGQMGALTAGMLLFAAAAVGINAVRPRAWSMVGFDPLLITADPLGSELEVIDSIAAGLSEGIQANNLRLGAMGRLLRVAGWPLITAPAIGAIAYQVSPLISASFEAALRLFPSGRV